MNEHMVTIVTANSGRCGTSLMMQMLKAAGVPLYWNREPNVTVINPHGHYEIDGRAASWTEDYARFIARQSAGKAVKIFWSKLELFCAAVEEARLGLQLIVMQRDAECMYKSQGVMLREENRLHEKSNSKRSVSGIIEGQNELGGWASSRRHLIVKFPQLFNGVAPRRVSNFLMLDKDAPAKMTACVEPSLWHFKPGDNTDPATVYNSGVCNSGISNPRDTGFGRRTESE
jgi:hypothetical protein